MADPSSYILNKCPQLLSMWDYTNNSITPESASVYDQLKVWWKCPSEHSWFDSVVNVYRRLTKDNSKWLCPVCNSLGAKNPELIKEMLDKDIDPFSISFGSHKKISWQCEKGHIWKASVNSRTEKRHSGCPVCKNMGSEVISSFLLKEWDFELNKGIDTNNVAKCSGMKVWWKCSICATTWQAYVNNREKSYKKSGYLTGCPNCRGSQVPKLEKSIFYVAPYLKKEWNSKNIIKPDNVSYSSGRKLWWKCNRGHEWEETPATRTSKNTYCPYCSGRRVCKDNCLMTKDPELCKEWHQEKNGLLTPNDVTQFSAKKVWWLCNECGEEWKTAIHGRSNGEGCPKCWKNILLKDGTCCDSFAEALGYLKLKEKGIDFVHNRIYPGFGRHRYDFFVPSINLYIEVTGFSEKYKHYSEYLENINKKRIFVENTLKASFQFVHHTVTKKDKSYVKRFMKRYNKNTHVIG